jgi:hypothetical protein
LPLIYFSLGLQMGYKKQSLNGEFSSDLVRF